MMIKFIDNNKCNTVKEKKSSKDRTSKKRDGTIIEVIIYFFVSFWVQLIIFKILYLEEVEILLREVGRDLFSPLLFQSIIRTTTTTSTSGEKMSMYDYMSS